MLSHSASFSNTQMVVYIFLNHHLGGLVKPLKKAIVFLQELPVVIVIV